MMRTLFHEPILLGRAGRGMPRLSHNKGALSSVLIMVLLKWCFGSAMLEFDLFWTLMSCLHLIEACANGIL
ncbi:hypothetical protein BJX65DRAFT_261117, partial [Aspergillus insuetus]